MRGLIKNKKKKGFTLIEMVAVVAIIGILAAVLVPKITGYLNEAKKTAVIDQARKVSQAYETAKMKGTIQVKDGTSPDDKLHLGLKVDVAIEKNTTMSSLIENADNLKNLGDLSKVTIGQCVAVTRGSDFTVKKGDNTGEMEFVPDSIDTSYVTE
ncbi:MAG: type II secretion system protein [Clostridium sp.]